MAKNRSCFSKLLHLLCFVICVNCEDTEYQPKNVKFNFFDFGPIKNIFLTESDLNISNMMNELVSKNWTEDQRCLIELKGIKNGLYNFEEWAIESKYIFSDSN